MRDILLKRRPYVIFARQGDVQVVMRELQFYATICAAERMAPSKAYFEFDAHPARITP